MVLAQPEPDMVLSNERLRASLAIRDWILGEAREIKATPISFWRASR